SSEGASGSRRSGVHQSGPWLLERPRLKQRVLYPVVLAVKAVGLVAGPERAYDLDPLLGYGIALVVGKHRRAEHLDLGGVPTGDDVERDTSVRDVVDRRHLLR